MELARDARRLQLRLLLLVGRGPQPAPVGIFAGFEGMPDRLRVVAHLRDGGMLVAGSLAALRRDYRLAAEPPWPARRELEPLPRRRAPRQFDLFEAA